jgi:TPR repeat protein
MRGIGVPVNTSEAIKKIERAAELGETEAIVYLGELYLEGIGVE